MKKTLFLMCLPMLALGFTSCSEDEKENPVGNNDDSKLVVTGRLESVTLGYSEENSWQADVTDFYANRYTVVISGFANLPHEMQVLLGLGLDLGVEVADNSSFNNAHKAKVKSIGSDNKFIVTTWATAGKTIYWRSYLLAGDVRQYDVTRSESIPTVQKGMSEMQVTVSKGSVGELWANLSVTNPDGEWLKSKGVGIAYSTSISSLDKEYLLSILKKDQWDARWEEGSYHLCYQTGNVVLLKGKTNSTLHDGDFHLEQLEPGTTYHYCAFVYVEDGSNSYIAVSNIEDFTTGGLGAAEIINSMSVSISADKANRQWRVRYSSSLESKYPDKSFSYRIVTGYPTDEYKYAVCMDETDMQTGSSYNGTIPYPTLIGLINIDPEEGGAETLVGGEVLRNLYERIMNGTADESDKAEYSALLRILGIEEVTNHDVPYVIALCVRVDNNNYWFIVAREVAEF